MEKIRIHIIKGQQTILHDLGQTLKALEMANREDLADKLFDKYFECKDEYEAFNLMIYFLEEAGYDVF